jgi:hypothetical protein
LKGANLQAFCVRVCEEGGFALEGGGAGNRRQREDGIMKCSKVLGRWWQLHHTGQWGG